MTTSDSSLLLRESALAAYLKPFLSISDKVLDIGAGSCNLAYLLREEGYNVVPIDLVDHNRTELELKLFDGETLPYKDNAFDVGLIVFVLHHAADYKSLVHESARVAKKLLIIEDSPNNLIERSAWRVIDYSLNHALHKDIAVAHRAQSVNNWQALFEQEGFRVTHAGSFRSLYTALNTYRHSLFVLERP